jgi:hypothetical protein
MLVMKEKMVLTFMSMYLLFLILTFSASAVTNYGNITANPTSVTFIAFFTEDDDILTEERIGSGYFDGQWYFNDSNFQDPPNIGEEGHIWLYGSNGICYHDSDTAGSTPVNWGDTSTSGSNIGPPGNLTAIPGHGSVTLNWNAADGATTYTIYRSVASNGAYETRVAEGVTETTYVDTGLSEQDHYYIVIGKDGSGNFGGHSNEATADSSLAVELSSFTALADGKKVTLKWQTSSEIGNIGFYVYRGENEDGPFKRISRLIKGAGYSAMGRAYEYIDQKVKTNRTYFYYLVNIDIHGARDKSDTIQATMKHAWSNIHQEYRLFQNYPNPFNPETWIPFQLPKASEVNIRIYNAAGQLVKTINLGYKQAGVYTGKSNAVYWNGRNDIGEKLASGIYFYELRTETFSTIRKMILLK